MFKSPLDLDIDRLNSLARHSLVVPMRFIDQSNVSIKQHFCSVTKLCFNAQPQYSTSMLNPTFCHCVWIPWLATAAAKSHRIVYQTGYHKPRYHKTQRLTQQCLVQPNHLPRSPRAQGRGVRHPVHDTRFTLFPPKRNSCRSTFKLGFAQELARMRLRASKQNSISFRFTSDSTGLPRASYAASIELAFRPWSL